MRMHHSSILGRGRRELAAEQVIANVPNAGYKARCLEHREPGRRKHFRQLICDCHYRRTSFN
jgi:hypothetical protein